MWILISILDFALFYEKLCLTFLCEFENKSKENAEPSGKKKLEELNRILELERPWKSPV